MEAKILYPIITTVLLLFTLVMQWVVFKPKSHFEAFMKRGVSIIVVMLYVITWVVWLFLLRK